MVSDPNDPEFQRQVLFCDLPRGAFFHVSFDELVSADANDTQATVYVMNVSIDGSEPGLFGDLIERESESERGDPRFGIDEKGRVFVTTRHSNTIYLTDLIAEQLVAGS